MDFTKMYALRTRCGSGIALCGRTKHGKVIGSTSSIRRPRRGQRERGVDRRQARAPDRRAHRAGAADRGVGPMAAHRRQPRDRDARGRSRRAAPDLPLVKQKLRHVVGSFSAGCARKAVTSTTSSRSSGSPRTTTPVVSLPPDEIAQRRSCDAPQEEAPAPAAACRCRDRGRRAGRVWWIFLRNVPSRCVRLVVRSPTRAAGRRELKLGYNYSGSPAAIRRSPA